MTEDTEKYKMVIMILRKSKPELTGTEIIEQNVMERIRRKGVGRPAQFSGLIEDLFGWFYIGWIRKSMMALSVLLVLFFVYQQTIILMGVNNINKRAIVNGTWVITVSKGDFEKQLLLLRLNSRRFSSGNTEISEKQVEQLLDSYNELQKKYSDIIRIIEEDPLLKEYIEKKLNETKNSKSNL